MANKSLPPELLDYTNDTAAAVLLNTPKAGKALLWGY